MSNLNLFDNLHATLQINTKNSNSTNCFGPIIIPNFKTAKLELHSNQIEGTIPAVIGNFTMLSKLLTLSSFL